MSFRIDATTDDAKEFVEAVCAAVEISMERVNAEWVHLIRVKNWFDSKWLGFSGVGRVPLDDPSLDESGVASEGLRQGQTTFPPFSPGRVLGEALWKKTGSVYEPQPVVAPVHGAERKQSAQNLHRRIRDAGDSALYLWYSSNSMPNGQGSAMAYTSSEGRVVGWYFSVARRPSHWAVSKVSGSVDADLRAAISGALEGLGS